jgi:hypothetical protein
MPPPGAVNYVEGQVSVNGQALSPQAVNSTVLAPNQRIDTGQGYAEVLLTPGTFLRIGHDSEVQVLSAGLADTRLSLVRGSAMVESEQVVKGQNVSILMNGATARIESKGLYDFDANQQGIRVLDGKAVVSEGDRNTTLKKGDQILLSSDKPLKKRGFDVKTAENDPLYAWSKVRSEQESAANLYTAQNVAANGGWYGPGWYWDPYWSFWAFMPGYGALYSPFGWGFYSPAFVWAAPFGHYGYFGHPYVHGYYAHGGMAGVHAAAGFHGGFHGGFGGFHGGGGRR